MKLNINNRIFDIFRLPLKLLKIPLADDNEDNKILVVNPKGEVRYTNNLPSNSNTETFTKLVYYVNSQDATGLLNISKVTSNVDIDFSFPRQEVGIFSLNFDFPGDFYIDFKGAVQGRNDCIEYNKEENNFKTYDNLGNLSDFYAFEFGGWIIIHLLNN
jgi:hypothetical protein